MAGAVQIAAKEGPARADIVAQESTTTSVGERAESEAQPTTTTPEPFVYRLGVLSGASTDNFWAYYGVEPTVWNSYVLGPTRPALYLVDGGELQPELVTGDPVPTWDGEGWRVRVTLDPGFRWSDGEPITADDFVFTFETVRALGLEGSWAEAFPAAIESVHAEDDYRLRIEFTQRPNLRVWPYGIGLAPIMAEHVWGEAVADVTADDLYAMPADGDVGGGPLVVAEVSAELVVSQANPGYPRGGFPDRVEYHVYADEDALVEAVAAGDVDAVMTPKGLTEEQVADVSDRPGVEVLTSPANGFRYLGFNLERAPMSDLAFRTALALLLDREQAAQQIPQAGEAAWTMIPAANDHWHPKELAAAVRDRYSGDMSERLDRALETLTAAGYAWDRPPAVGEDGAVTPGEGLTVDGVEPQPLTILTPGDAYDPARPAYVGRIAETLQMLGFDARPVETDFDTVVDLAFTPGEDGNWQYDMYVLGWTLGNPTLPAFYRPFFAPGGEVNNTGYASKTFTRALRDYEAAFTIEEARGALLRMEEALAVHMPYLALYNNRLTELYRSDRVQFDLERSLGGLQGRLGGLGDVTPAG